MTQQINQNGQTVEVPDTIESAVALEYSFVEALVQLDVNVTGIADDNEPEQLDSETKDAVGSYVSVGTRLEPNFDAIKEAEPQVIFANEKRHKDIYDKLNQIAPTVLVKSFDANYEESIEAFKFIAQVTNKEDEGREVVEQHNNRVKELESEISIDKDKTTVALVPTSEGVVVHASNSYVGQLLEKVGFNTSISENEESHFPGYMGADYLELSVDELAKFDPERIIVMTDEANQSDYENLSNNATWKDLNAVANNCVHEVNREVWAKQRGLKASELILKDIAHFEG